MKSFLLNIASPKKWGPTVLYFILSFVSGRQNLFAQYVVPQTGAQNITVCLVTLTDNGGSSNYLPSSNGTLTIYPGIT
ncbi:MAG: hypothetical protein H7282_03280 [Cytophagaceae bacterium]|nr:hypothetical protein [Cytophagaceae bacterium]